MKLDVAQLFPGGYVLCVRFSAVVLCHSREKVLCLLYVKDERRIKIVSLQKEVVKEETEVSLENSGNLFSPYSPL